MTAVKIRYEKLAGNAKGATSFIGMVYMDDGSKVPVQDYAGDTSALPVEHEVIRVSEKPVSPELSFPKIKR